MSRADLLVVGGGPGGAALASFAAEQGARVIVLERDRFPRDKCAVNFSLRKAARCSAAWDCSTASCARGRADDLVLAGRRQGRHRSRASGVAGAGARRSVSRAVMDEAILRHAASPAPTFARR
jgi:flavin-dependent dehydrogenase